MMSIFWFTLIAFIVENGINAGVVVRVSSPFVALLQNCSRSSIIRVKRKCVTLELLIVFVSFWPMAKASPHRQFSYEENYQKKNIRFSPSETTDINSGTYSICINADRSNNNNVFHNGCTQINQIGTGTEWRSE